MSKPHKGIIRSWRKILISEELKYHKHYGLGFCIGGIPEGHPDFMDHSWIRTSSIIKMEGNEVETLNSRYTLVGPL